MFDSSALNSLNCFAQKFIEPGTWPYRLVEAGATPALTAAVVAAYPFTITVTPATGGASQQTNVVVKRGDGGLVADPAQVTVNAGDVVLWNTTDASIQGFAVEVQLPVQPVARAAFLALPQGMAAKVQATGSQQMHNNVFFTHAFGLPGDYPWQDANGGKARGIIHVHTMEVKSDADRKAWLDKLQEGVGITIQGDAVDKPEVDILAGQTVVWSINGAAGIRIVSAAEPGTQTPVIS